MLFDSFEEAVAELIKGTVELAIIPSAYVNFAKIVFENLNQIEIVDSFVYETPSLIIVTNNDRDIKKIATHPSPSSLIVNYYPDSEILYSRSNSHSAELLKQGQVQACITTSICAEKYDFKIVKDFGVVSMSWNIFSKKGESSMIKCVSETNITKSNTIQELYCDDFQEIIVNKIHKGSVFSSHQHKESQFVYGLQGEFILAVESCQYLIRKKEYYFIESNKIHSALPITEFMSVDIKYHEKSKAKTLIDTIKIVEREKVIQINQNNVLFSTNAAEIEIMGKQYILEPMKIYKFINMENIDVKVNQESLYIVKLLEKNTN